MMNEQWADASCVLATAANQTRKVDVRLIHTMSKIRASLCANSCNRDMTMYCKKLQKSNKLCANYNPAAICGLFRVSIWPVELGEVVLESNKTAVCRNLFQCFKSHYGKEINTAGIWTNICICKIFLLWVASLKTLYPSVLASHSETTVKKFASRWLRLPG